MSQRPLFMLTDRDPTVLNRFRLGGQTPDTAVYVGRPTRWGNPFRVGVHGNREEVLDRYETWARRQLANDPYWLAPLRNKDLICWCAPKECHADVLLKLMEEQSCAPTV